MTINYAKKVYIQNTYFATNPNIVNVDLMGVPFENNNMDNAFVDCTSLTSVKNINENVNNMPRAFRNCTSFVGPITIPNSVASMTASFWNCTSFNGNFKTPTNIGKRGLESVLRECTNVTEIPNIPSYTESLFFSFTNCHGVQNIPDLYNLNSLIFLNSTFGGWDYIVDMPRLPESGNLVYIPWAFAWCNNLKNANTIPQGVADMYYTFCNCFNLTSAPQTLPNSVTNVAGTFYWCNNVQTLPNMPDSAINAGWYAYHCYVLQNMPHISNNLTYAKSMFCNCYEMKSTVPVSIPDGITDMSFSFYQCHNITDIAKISNNATSIYYAFFNSGLVNAPVSIPGTCINAEQSFRNCFSLVNGPVSIENGVTNVRSMFYCCNNLKNVPDLPDSVTDGLWYCYGCTNLENGPKKISNQLTNIHSMFCDCPSLLYAPNIPASVNQMMYAFQNCNSLTGDIYIYSENITSANYSFYSNGLRKNVYIPFTYENGVNTKTYNAFKTAGYKNDGSVCGVYLMEYVPPANPYAIKSTEYQATFVNMNTTTKIADEAHLTNYIGSLTDVNVPIRIEG